MKNEGKLKRNEAWSSSINGGKCNWIV